jgi:hypothetical protein
LLQGTSCSTIISGEGKDWLLIWLNIPSNRSTRTTQ